MTTITLKKTYASLPRTTRGKPIVVNGDPKGKNFLYTNGNNIYIREADDPSECDIYAEHPRETTVAKYSPSGFYIASGDTSGHVRVWDTTQKEHILKIDHSALGGPVKDIDWTMDNQRLVVVGEGRESFGRAFTWDSGNSTGQIDGHTKHINSCSIKQTRPIKVATASEDFSSMFYEGPPFKFKCSKSDHGNFVNCVRFSPDGSVYVTAGSDGKLFIYDGTSSDLISEMGAPKAHAGGIYAISFNKDGSKLLTVSGDKTAKIWNMESKTEETLFKMGSGQLQDMQVGCLWQGDNIMTVSLSGHINYLDPANPAQPRRCVKGHNKPIVGMTVSPDGSKFYTSGSDGLIVSWNSATGENEEFKGKGHTNQVNDLALDGDYVVSVGIDDTVRFTDANTGEYGSAGVKLSSQPTAVASLGGVAVVACLNSVCVFEAPGKKLSEAPISDPARCVSIRPGGGQVAVGTDKRMHIFELSGGELMEVKSQPMEDCNAVAYSPDGANLAASSKQAIFMFDVEDEFKEKVGGWGKQHTAKVKTICWSPDSRRFATSGIDTHIIVWNPTDFVGKKAMIKAHPLSHVNSIGWLDNNTIITAGQDSNIKLWSVSD